MAAFKSYLIALTALLSLTFSSAHRAQILSPILVHSPIPAGPIAAEPAPDSSHIPSGPVPAGPFPPQAAGPIPVGPSPPTAPEHVVPKSAPVHETASVPVSSGPGGAGDVAAEDCGRCDGPSIPGCGGGCGCKPPPVPKPYYCQPIKKCGFVGGGGGFTIYLGGGQFAAPAVSGDHEVNT